MIRGYEGRKLRQTVAVVVALSLAGLCLPVQAQRAGENQRTERVEGESVRHADVLSKAFREASHAVLPAVVSIQSASKPRERSPQNQPFRGTPFEEFFDMPAPRESVAMGSGVVIDPKGIILTNNHVVAGSENIRVTLASGEVYEAKEVRADPKSDVAVLWIEPKSSLHAARLGDSDELDVGDWVLAIGAPFGLDQTVSAGIISAKGRGLGAAFREDFLQTDAAINMGNSGGPLVNLRGEVVGVNTAIASSTGVFAGVGFAIPIDMAKWAADQLIKNGKVTRAYLGVSIQPMTAELADEFGLRVNEGVVVADVVAGAPAQQAGLAPGDVILRFADKPISSGRELQRVVEVREIGSSQQVLLLREGKQQTISVKMQEQPEEYGLARRGARGPERPDSSQVPGVGIEVQELTPEIARQLGFDGPRRGVVIRSVESGSSAARAGLQPGMVITEANREPVASADQFRKVAEEAKENNGRLLMRVVSPDGSRFVVIRVR